jgi:hypothetical protein
MFQRTFAWLLAGCLVAGTSRAAREPFIGDWKLNPSKSKLTDQMKVESIAANKYSLDFTGDGSAETIVTDGTDQPGYSGTTLSITVEGPDSWKVVRKKEGRIIITAKWKLSQDGKTLTDDFTGTGANGSTFNLKYVYQRKAGTSGFAGTWESTSETLDSVFVLQIRPYQGDGLSFIDPSEEETKSVKFDGKDYPNVGPNVPAGYASAIRRVDPHSLEMTDKINGKVSGTEQIKLSPDEKTLTITVHSPGRSEPNILVFERQ